MNNIARQLEGVRRVGRWMLVAQRLSQWIAGIIVAALMLGLLDYMLRLPAYVRLVVAVGVVVLAGMWLAGRLRRALAFSPGLDQLALRLERMYPQFSGSLATAIDFTTHLQQYQSPQHTADLVHASVEKVRQRLSALQVGRLLDPARTLRLAAVMMLALLAAAAVVSMVPAHSRIAAQRWLAPLGSTEWPKRTQIGAAGTEAVWPVDTPLRLAATIERGYDPAMRVQVRYRIIDHHGQPGTWHAALMTQQTRHEDSAPLFERQIELPEALIRSLQSSGDGAVIEYAFKAGDDETPVVRMSLVARPQLTGLTAVVTPPAYARGLVATQTIDWFKLGGQTPTLSALRGSTIDLSATFNKPSVELVTTQPMSFVLKEPVEFPLRLVDEHGLTDLSERRYRIESITDKPPTVSLVQPVTDEAVLSTASVNIRAAAQDDVAVEDVQIQAVRERAWASPTSPEASLEEPATTLAVEAGRRAELAAEHVLELSTLSVAPGDTVVLTGVARDIFNLDGQQHEPVRSASRRLRIIDEAALIEQLRIELAALRQHAVRLEQSQQGLLEDASPRAAAVQDDITRRLTVQASLVQALISRAMRNRLDEPAMHELMQTAGDLVDQAQASSEAAGQKLAQPEAAPAQEATQDQQRVAETLSELVALLDQGRDALSLQLKLRQMQAAQSNLAEQARELFPETVGQDVENLDPSLQEALRDLQQKQQAMSDEAGELARQMQEAARNLAQQPDDRSQAAAQALAEAAAIAQRQGLNQSMQRSAEAIGENQLSQAGMDQAQSLDTLTQMLSEMGTQQQRMVAMLRRRLQKLAQTIEQLIQRQKGEIASLDGAAGPDALPALEPAQSAVRRSTMAAHEQAKTPETEPVAGQLDQAVQAQGRAVLALREREHLPAKEAESAALAALEAALEALRLIEQQAAQHQARQARAELKAEYEKLADRQAALCEAVAPLAGIEVLSRRQRADLIDLGHRQSDVQAAVSDLRQQIDDTLVFRHLHQRIDELAGQAVARLRSGTAEQSTLADQQRVVVMLRTMASALDEDARDEPFAGQQGGGGGGGGGDMPMVPPLAELKLLRGMQEAIYDQTRSLNDPGTQEAALTDLAARQRELAGLGERLMEMVRQRSPRPPHQE